MRILANILRTFKVSSRESCKITNRRYSSQICPRATGCPCSADAVPAFNVVCVRSFTTTPVENKSSNGGTTADTFNSSSFGKNNDSASNQIIPVALLKTENELDASPIKVLVIPINLFNNDKEAVQKTLSTMSLIQANAEQIEAFTDNADAFAKKTNKNNKNRVKEPLWHDLDAGAAAAMQAGGNHGNGNIGFDDMEEVLAERVQARDSNDFLQWNNANTFVVTDVPANLEKRLTDAGISSMDLEFEMDMTNVKDAILMGDRVTNYLEEIDSMGGNMALPDPMITMSTSVENDSFDMDATTVPLNLNARIQGIVNVDSTKLTTRDVEQMKVPQFNDYVTSVAANICSTALQKGFPTDVSRMYSTKPTTEGPKRPKSPHIVCEKQGDKGCISPGNSNLQPYVPKSKKGAAAGGESSATGAVAKERSVCQCSETSLLTSTIIGDTGARGLMSCKAYALALKEAERLRELFAAAKSDGCGQKKTTKSAEAGGKCSGKVVNPCEEDKKGGSGGSSPCGSKPEPSKCAASKPEPSKCAASKPEPSKCAASKPEPSKCAVSKSEPSECAASKPEPSKCAASKPEPSKCGGCNPEPPKQAEKKVAPSCSLEKKAKSAEKRAKSPHIVCEKQGSKGCISPGNANLEPYVSGKKESKADATEKMNLDKARSPCDTKNKAGDKCGDTMPCGPPKQDSICKNKVIREPPKNPPSNDPCSPQDPPCQRKGAADSLPPKAVICAKTNVAPKTQKDAEIKCDNKDDGCKKSPFKCPQPTKSKRPTPEENDNPCRQNYPKQCPPKTSVGNCGRPAPDPCAPKHECPKKEEPQPKPNCPGSDPCGKGGKKAASTATATSTASADTDRVCINIKPREEGSDSMKKSCSKRTAPKNCEAPANAAEAAKCAQIAADKKSAEGKCGAAKKSNVASCSSVKSSASSSSCNFEEKAAQSESCFTAVSAQSVFKAVSADKGLKKSHSASDCAAQSKSAPAFVTVDLCRLPIAPVVDTSKSERRTIKSDSTAYGKQKGSCGGSSKSSKPKTKKTCGNGGGAGGASKSKKASKAPEELTNCPNTAAVLTKSTKPNCPPKGAAGSKSTAKCFSSLLSRQLFTAAFGSAFNLPLTSCKLGSILNVPVDFFSSKKKGQSNIDCPSAPPKPMHRKDTRYPSGLKNCFEQDLKDEPCHRPPPKGKENACNRKPQNRACWEDDDENKLWRRDLNLLLNKSPNPLCGQQQLRMFSNSSAFRQSNKVNPETVESNDESQQLKTAVPQFQAMPKIHEKPLETLNEIVKIGAAGEILKTTEPIEDVTDYDVLVRIAAIAVSGSDIHVYETGSAKCSNLTLGHDATGIIEKVGKCVDKLKPGDYVAMESGLCCGICDVCKQGNYNLCSQLFHNGFFSTHQTHPADLCHKIPTNVSLEDATLTSVLALGLQACYKGKITPTSNVLVMGTSPKACAAALCARALGAQSVAILSPNVYTLESVRILFDFDYIHYYDNESNLKEKVVERVCRVLKDRPDVVINCAISEATMHMAVNLLKPGGTCVLAECDNEYSSFNALDMLMKSISLITSFRSANMFPAALNLLKSGKTPIGELVSRVYTWDQIKWAFHWAQYEANMGNRKVVVRGPNF